MKSFRIRAISLLVSVSFIFTGLTPSYGLAPGTVSGDLRPNGAADEVKNVVRASEGILHVIKESGYDIGDIAGQTEPPIGENSGVAERRVYSRDEVMADLKVSKDQNQIRYLAYDLNNVLGRCLDKAQLPVDSGKSRVEIRDFPMGEGELALMRMAKYGVGSGRGEELVLEVSTEFAVNYSKIAANDILFKIAGGRFVSVAQGLAYRLGRHEAAWAGKKGGHYAGNGMELVRPEGADAYSIDGRYSVYNDAIMMWYVFSYCQDAAVWFNNENFGKLLNGAYYGGSGNGRTRAFKSYFPDLYNGDGTRNEERFGAAASLAKWINYNYFIKPVKDGSGASSGKDVYQAVLDVVGSRARNASFDMVRGRPDLRVRAEKPSAKPAKNGTVINYPPEDETKRIEALKKDHARIFGSSPAKVSRGAARANIIGEHVDYPSFDGAQDAHNYSLPFALPYSILISGKANETDVIDLYSADFKQRYSFRLSDLDAMAKDKDFIESLRADYNWVTYFMGLCYAAKQKGFKLSGGEFTIQGNIPIGSGISSSAAYTVASTLLLKDFGGWDVSGVDIAKTARWGENVDFNPFVGSKCGLLDQIASVMSEKDNAVLIDYGNLSGVKKVNFDLGGYTFVLVDSKVPRKLAETEYNTRVEELKRVPEVMNRLLRAINPEHMDKTHVSAFTVEELNSIQDEFQKKEPVLFKRARHVITEKQRTLDLFEALKVGNLRRAGEILNEAGDSLSMKGDFEISGKVKMPDGSFINALDILVDSGCSAGAYGRMMGGGGGGCAFFMVKKSELDAWKASVASSYREKSGFSPVFYDAVPSEGSKVVFSAVPEAVAKPVISKEAFTSDFAVKQFFGWVNSGHNAAAAAYLEKAVNYYEGSREELIAAFRDKYIKYLLTNAPPLRHRSLRDHLAGKDALRDFALAIAGDEEYGLEKDLDSRDLATRSDALQKLASMIKSGGIVCADPSDESNVHVHSFFSFSPYSPEATAYWLKRAGLSVGGIIDHDTAEGCDLFTRAAETLEQKSTSGLEFRVSMPGTKFADMALNAPGVANMNYFLCHGLPSKDHPAMKAMTERIQTSKNARNRKMMNNVNARLAASEVEVTVNFDKDVAALSELGNCTDRHLMTGTAEVLNRRYSGEEREAVYAKIFNKSSLSASEKKKVKSVEGAMELLREYLLKPGVEGTCFIQPDENECPPLPEAVKTIKEAGGIPVYPYLGMSAENKTKEEDVLEELFDYLKASGVMGIAIMPHRNTDEEIARVIRLADSKGLRVFSGVDINKATMPFIQDRARVSRFPQFKAGADFLVGHEFLSRFLGVGYYSEYIISPDDSDDGSSETSARFRYTSLSSVLPDDSARFDFFASVGALPFEELKKIEAAKVGSVTNKDIFEYLVARHAMINRKNIVRLLSGAGDGDGSPRMVSARVASGLAGNVLTLTADLPGVGRFDIISTPTVGQMNALMARDGNHPYKLGDAPLLPWANRQGGERKGGDLLVAVAGNQVALAPNIPDDGSPKAMAHHGLVFGKASDTEEVIRTSKGDVINTTIEAGDFGTGWPSSTRVSMSTSLAGKVLTHTIKANNNGKKDTEIAIGRHPYFRLPGERSRWMLRVPSARRVEWGDGMKPTGRVQDIPSGSEYDFSRLKPLGSTFLDDCFVLPERDKDGNIVVELVDPVTGAGIRVYSPSQDIRAIQVYAPPDKDFVAIELQYNLPFSLDKALWRGSGLDPGMVTLKPGAETEYVVKYEVFKYEPPAANEDGRVLIEEHRASESIPGVGADPFDATDPRLAGLSDEACGSFKEVSSCDHVFMSYTSGGTETPRENRATSDDKIRSLVINGKWSSFNRQTCALAARNNPGYKVILHPQIDDAGDFLKRFFLFAAANVDILSLDIEKAREVYKEGIQTKGKDERVARKAAEEASCDEIAKYFIDMGAKTVVINMRENGALALGIKGSILGERSIFVPAARVFGRIEGSAEAFNAGLAYGLFNGWDAERTMTAAVVFSALNAQIKGGKVLDSDYIKALRYLDIYRQLAKYTYVGVSMGGTNFRAAVMDGLGRAKARAEVKWADAEKGFGARARNMKANVTADEVTGLIEREIRALLAGIEIPASDLGQIYVCSTGPLDEIRSSIGYPAPTTNLPFNDYLLMEELSVRLLGKEAAASLAAPAFVLQHDGKGGLNGEFDDPDMNGTTVIQGTGMNATAMKNGVHVTSGGAITEWGHAMIGEPVKSGTLVPFPEYSFRYAGEEVGQNHPRQVVDVIPADVVGTSRVTQYITRAEAVTNVMGQSPENRRGTAAAYIWKTDPKDNEVPVNFIGAEYDVEDLVSGRAISEMLARKNDLVATFGGTLEDYASLTSARDLSEAALAGNEQAVKVIQYIARIMGNALGAYIAMYKDEPFVRHIRLVSTVGEKLGKGVGVDESGQDVYMRTIRSACRVTLERKGIDAQEAETLAAGITRSEGNAYREIVAALPNVKAYGSVGNDEMTLAAASMKKEGTDLYVADSIMAGQDMNEVKSLAKKLGARVMTFSNLEELGQRLADPEKASRACVDLGGLDLKENDMAVFFAANPFAMNARFVNSEIPKDMGKKGRDEKKFFIERVVLRMAVVRALTKADVENVTPLYRLARVFLHPYMPLGYNVNDYLARIVNAPAGEPAAFARNLVYIVKAILQFKPIETYNTEELKRVTEFMYSA